ncbi:MAG: hypothetical protein EXS39_03365 [Opitutaceae bacterium]|nr:hypothetical protein [Opitutaceae bacterium]
MSSLRVGMVGFDISPRFHPQFGAWGTTPSVTKLDMPLLSRCLALEQDSRRLVWFGSDLVGDPIIFTESLRDEVAGALGLRREQLIWSTSQTHASGAIPGSIMCGSTTTELVRTDAEFVAAERRRFIDAYIAAARHALDRLQPASVWVGRGYCDSISYNSRFPMPTGGCKFSRSYAEGLQGGKYYDPTIGLVRFEDNQGKPIGAIFNFNCHPAVLIVQNACSPDYVGTARQYVEEAIGGAPAMFLQGFCGDCHPRHMFGTPEQAKQIGARLGKQAAKAMQTLIPVRSVPFAFAWETIQLPCQPMPSREELEDQQAQSEAFIEELKSDPQATWCCGFNFTETFSAEDRAHTVRSTIEYRREALRMLAAGEPPRRELPITLGAVRIGDMAAALSPGENFTLTGLAIRTQSPFAHTLVCGDTNGLFGYIGDDHEIDRGGFETDFFWKFLIYDGLRTPPAKGSAQRIIQSSLGLLQRLKKGA